MQIWPNTVPVGFGISKSGTAIDKYENSYQGQRSRSNVTNFRSLLAFTVGHIPTKLHRFPTSSFRDFVQTDRHKQTNVAKNNTCLQHSWHVDNNKKKQIMADTVNEMPSTTAYYNVTHQTSGSVSRSSQLSASCRPDFSNSGPTTSRHFLW